MKIFEYERNHLGDRPKIQIESIEDKVKFLVQVLQRLKVMYIKGVKDRIDEIHEKMGINESDLDYPTIPDHLKNIVEKKMDSSLNLDQ
jgi:chromosome condensin MukBEF ATPase and DNA-binding subunit MukB